MRKAIVFTAMDRIVYLKKTLDSWEKVRGLDDYDFYFKIEPSEHTQGILDVIGNFDSHRNSVSTILLNKKVLGNGFNAWEALDSLFQKYDFVILAEDDIIVSKDILEYFNFTEKMFNDKSEIAIVSANTKGKSSEAHLLVRENVFNGLVWGTWKKYWNDFFKNTWDLDYSSGTEDQPQSGWDWNLTLRVLPNNNLFTIHPYVSRSQHIGMNGMHCTEQIFEFTQSPSFKEDNKWDYLEEA